jgi:hypothetical protein
MCRGPEEIRTGLGTLLLFVTHPACYCEVCTDMDKSSLGGIICG